jgi:RAT1-interacting protein
MADSSALPNLPTKPWVSPSEREDNSPPRKRPRTRAPPQSAAPSSKQSAETNTTDTRTANNQTTPTATEAQTTESQPRSHTFSIQPVHRFKGAATSIKRPREVAHFSYDDAHKYHADDSSINYYVPPPLGVDLKEGFDTFRRHEDKEDAHLDSLLQALVDKEKKDGDQTWAKADFVTWRGMMTKVC